ncbi:MAG: FCSD flavin-binding domain-containing protein [Guyparkeria sp.]|uniref:FCSD flavin-binding domain-containing protein n=1 Tax=Guyparkeria sp. TaxID=2035736 RepID=UPI0039784009
MSTISRRSFLKLAGAGTAGAGMLGTPLARSASQSRVVIVGGGVGGATAAKYLKLYAPEIEVTIIEPKREYQRPYGSSEVITGQVTMEDITISYDALKNRHGVKFVHDTVTDVDYDDKQVITAGGEKVGYDRLVLSPGISFDFDAIEGLTEDLAETKLPHGWDAGDQLLELKEQLKAVPEDGTVIVGPPPGPYRCPPGPYERAGLIAQWLLDRGDKNPKVIILDPKNGFTTDYSMLHAWNRLYRFNIPEPARSKYNEEELAELKTHDEPGPIEWIMGDMGGQILKVDAENMTVEAEAGVFEADMINIIPPLKAARIAFDLDLVDGSGWCPVDQKTFESTRHPDVHVIGDSCIAGAMPKSGYAANSQAKVLAIQLRALLAGNEPVEPVFQNTCYALAGNTESGMFVADVFRVEDGQIVRVDEQRYLPFDATQQQIRLAALYQHNWMTAFTEDCFS